MTQEPRLPVLQLQLKMVQAGTSTSATGDFTVSVPSNAILVFTATGLMDQEVSVGNKTTINVKLTATATNLDQVVVVGYGTQRKEAVTGSVASIGGDRLRDVPSPNITQALQGRLAGVDISQTSTRPGATMQIRIRGNGCYTCNHRYQLYPGRTFP